MCLRCLTRVCTNKGADLHLSIEVAFLLTRTEPSEEGTATAPVAVADLQRDQIDISLKQKVIPISERIPAPSVSELARDTHQHQPNCGAQSLSRIRYRKASLFQTKSNAK